MNKQRLILLAVGAAAGYFLADKLTGLRVGNFAPFQLGYNQGSNLA
jgi:hypothetical protein